VVSSVESREVVLPGLMRLEAEGGMLLIQGLLRSIQAAGSDTTAAAAARMQLLKWCRRIISTEAAASTALEARANQKAAAAAAAAATAGASPLAGAAVGDVPLRDALYGMTWEHAVRAPLVVQAVQVIGSTEGPEFKQELRSCFMALARLMCSNHALIRAAIYQVVASKQFQEMITEAIGR